MRVSQATVNYYLKTSKVLSDGSSPIMLRVCYHGFKDISSHYSCPVKYWDKKNQQVKKGFGANYAVINYELNKLKGRVINKRDEYIRLGIEYTPSMLLSFDDENKKVVSNIVVELIDRYYVDKVLKSGTVKSWKYSRNLIDEFQRGVIISEIDEGWCKRYARFLELKGQSDGSIRNRLGHIGTIYRYACELGIADMNRFPFRSWNYCREYKLAEKMQFVHQRSVEVMKEYFLSKVIKMTGERRFTYIDDGYINYKNRLFPLYFWLLGYMFQGLSPIDLCMLRKEDIERVVVNGEDYYSVNTTRSKTGVSVKIRIKVHSIYSQVMINRMLMSGDGWFLPIMHGMSVGLEEGCYKTRLKAIMSYWMNTKLKDWWREINQVIIQKNVSEGCNIPLIDEDNTYYSYRHSYAQTFMQRGGTPMALATLLGRSENTLGVYLKQLSEEEDLVEAVSVMSD